MSTLKELLAQQAELSQKIEEVRQHEVANAIQTVSTIVAEYGLTVEDVFPNYKPAVRIVRNIVATPAKAKGEPKYRSSVDSSKTWSGKGRKPDWVITYLANNGRLEDLLINKPA